MPKQVFTEELFTLSSNESRVLASDLQKQVWPLKFIQQHTLLHELSFGNHSNINIWMSSEEFHLLTDIGLT